MISPLVVLSGSEQHDTPGTGCLVISLLYCYSQGCMNGPPKAGSKRLVSVLSL